MPKNQNKPKAKKYRRDRNHAESLENIDFFSIIKIKSIILVYYPPAFPRGVLQLLFGLSAVEGSFDIDADKVGEVVESHRNLPVVSETGVYYRGLFAAFLLKGEHSL